MKHTGGKWDASGVLTFEVTLEPGETRYYTSDEPLPNGATIEVTLNLGKLRLHLAQIARRMSGRGVQASGAIKFKRTKG